VSSTARPAFYALAPGGWRDYATLLHPPYTLWHLSYVAIGAALAPEWHPARLAAAIAAFFLAVGIGAHALDELNGRPLDTGIPSRVLGVLATLSIAGAAAIGIGGAIAYDLWLLAFVAAGVFAVYAYNLELFGGRLHNDASFALAWGAFPLLTGYFAAVGQIRWEALLAAAFAALSSYGQRQLSTPVRRLRRQVTSVSGSLELTDGRREPITRETLIAGNEAALRAFAAAIVALAVALVALRAT
jgi:heme O synthase-like polyprenyltransferase